MEHNTFKNRVFYGGNNLLKYIETSDRETIRIFAGCYLYILIPH